MGNQLEGGGPPTTYIKDLFLDVEFIFNEKVGGPIPIRKPKRFRCEAEIDLLSKRTPNKL